MINRLRPASFRQWLPLIWIAIALFGISGEARAQVGQLSCTVAITNIAFGSIDVLTGASVASNGTLSVSCTNGFLRGGSMYLCVAIPARSMTGSATSTALAYDIFGPTPATTSWSNTTPIVIPFSSLGLNQTYTANVQAAVLVSQQTALPDSYSQTLAATASFGTSSCTSGSANTSSVSVRATATVTKSCNITASNLAFPPVGDLNSVVDGQSALSVRCSKNTGYSISLDGGISGASNPAARKMTAGSEFILYGLYQNSARSTPWSSSATVGGTGTAGTQSIPVYGRVPVQATPSIGTYSDTIVVTVTY